MDKNIILTIAVCTYNRADLLRGCLDSLAGCEDKTVEVLIIDNNSIDRTGKVAEEFVKSDPNFNYLTEDKQGLSHARNRAIAEAKGKYIAYLDDDAKAEENWIRNVLELIKKNPEVVVFGGMIKPFYLSNKPNWFRDEYEIRTWGESMRYLEKGEAFSGSNLILKKEYLNKNSFNINLGVKSKELKMGEETELQWNLQAELGTEGNFLYSPDLCVYHLVPDYKMKLNYYMKRSIASGQSNYEMKKGDFRKNANMAINHTLNIGFRSLKALIRIFKYKSMKQWAFENLVPVMHSSGFVLAFFGIKLKFKNQ
jgi:glycosyltransferase involved in cell wall biosynthesis